VRWFTAFVALTGASAMVGGTLGLAVGVQSDTETVAQWGVTSFAVLIVATAPWILFGLQYTGRLTSIRRRTVAAIALPPLAGALLIWLTSTDTLGHIALSVTGTVLIFYAFFLLMVGAYLLVRTTYEYGHLSIGQGLSLAVSGFAPILIVNVTGALATEVETIAVGMYASAFVVAAAAVVLALFRYDTFESTPAAGTVGERAIASETDDLLFVLDREGQLIRVNNTARDRLATADSALVGGPIEAVLDTPIEALREQETVDLETVVGRRQFDPQVSEFTDQHDRPLGFVVSLRDVTERELREQRLEVLNRVLRHNLRNRVEVIRSNAEELSAQTNSGYAETIIDSADGLTELGAKARAIDRFVSRSVRETERDLVTELETLVAAADGEITLTAPGSAPLVTDWGALTAALESAIENAVEYADNSVAVSVEKAPDGYTITVADDGPGIPDSELAALDAGTETALQHGTGLGLWRLKWGVTKLNGDLSFDTDEGTTVRITVPDHSSTRPEDALPARE
jgi:signal transduction histidine kinase